MNPDKRISVRFAPNITAQQMETILGNFPNESILKIRRFREFDVIILIEGETSVDKAINWLMSQKWLIMEAEELTELTEWDKLIDEVDLAREKQLRALQSKDSSL